MRLWILTADDKTEIRDIYFDTIQKMIVKTLQYDDYDSCSINLADSPVDEEFLETSKPYKYTEFNLCQKEGERLVFYAGVLCYHKDRGNIVIDIPMTEVVSFGKTDVKYVPCLAEIGPVSLGPRRINLNCYVDKVLDRAMEFGLGFWGCRSELEKLYGEHIIIPKLARLKAYTFSCFSFIRDFALSFEYSDYVWELPDHNIDKAIEKYAVSSQNTCYIYLDYDNGNAVIRLFHNSGIFDEFQVYRGTKAVETNRILIEDNKTTAYYKAVGGWKEYDLNLIPRKLFEAEFVGVDKRIWNTKFRFYKELFKGDWENYDYLPKYLLNVVFPAYDNLYKLADGHYLYQELTNTMSYWADESGMYLEVMFGYGDLNEKSFAKAIGVTQKMLNTILTLNHMETKRLTSDLLIRQEREALGTMFMKSMDSALFDRMLRVDVLCKFSNGYCGFKEFVDMFGTENLERFIAKIEEMVDTEDWTSFEQYQDYLCLLAEFHEEFPQFTWNVAIPDGLREMHDELTTIYSMKKTSINSEQRRMFDEEVRKWDKYGFQKDGLSIVIPSDPMDVVKEGTVLHHCAGSFLNPIIRGVTVLLFIRKDTEPDKPYYTLEIRDNKVRQCHGFANCNMTPELQDFVEAFCEAKGIEFIRKNADLMLAG